MQIAVPSVAAVNASIAQGNEGVMSDTAANGFEPEIIAFCCEH
jgi:hypothetical protein